MTLSNSAYWWRIVTHLGAAGILVPIFAAQVVSLWSSQRASAQRWLAALCLAVFLTLASKCLFWGWGIGIVSWDFTGVSGHTLLATSIFPVLFRIHTPFDSPRMQHAVTALGLLLAACIGISRIVLGAHSLSEVCAGWTLGLIVSVVAISALERSHQQSPVARYSPLLLLLAFNPAAAHVLPTHDWEVKLALSISGRTKPFTRIPWLKTNKDAPVDIRPATGI